MKHALASLLPGRLAMAAGAVVALASGAASAVEFLGGTAGCFTATTCAPPAADVVPPAAQVLAFNGLTYRNSTFDVFSAGSNAHIGGVVGRRTSTTSARSP